MFNPRSILLFVLLLGVAPGADGQFRTVSTESPGTKVFPVSELKEGMRGTARSVFRGAASEEFSVEILGVVPNWIGPKQDLIIGRLSGTNAERTSVFAGMSGSPVYIDGKLVGAISYSFPFAKEPICGITPFDQMRSVMEQPPKPQRSNKREPRIFTTAELYADTWTPALPSMRNGVASGFAAESRLTAIAGQTFAPIATPVTFAGISPEALSIFTPALISAGLLPVNVPGGSTDPGPMKKATETTLRGGDSVVVALARGDIQIAASGTVTLREGNRIYAFGHPFFSLGSTSLPMSESHVVTVVPNANNSFKLAVADSLVGTLTQDRNTAVYGLLGEAPKMLPVRIRLVTSNGTVTETKFETVLEETLTPLIINAGVAAALNASERSVGESTIEINSEIAIKGSEPLRLTRRFASAQAMAFAASATSVPLAALLRASFDDLELTGITIDLKAVDGSRKATVERMMVDRTQVRAGETVQISVIERSPSGSTNIRQIPLRIPDDAAAGSVTIAVSDGSVLQQAAPLTQYAPRTATEFVSLYNKARKADRLYAVISRTTKGTIVGAAEMPNLPPSVLATLNSERAAGAAKSSVTTVLAEVELPRSEMVVTGSQSLTLEIVR